MNVNEAWAQLTESMNDYALEGKGGITAILLTEESAKYLLTRVGKRHKELRTAVENAALKASERAAGHRIITVRLEA